MNIMEYCKEMGVSRATLYRRAKEAGLDLAALRGEDGELSDKGLSMLASVFDGTRQTPDTSQTRDAHSEPPGDVANDVAQLKQMEDLRRRCETLEGQLEASQARIDLLEATLTRERENGDGWRQMALKQQALLLPAAHKRRGLFDRLRAAITGERGDNDAD